MINKKVSVISKIFLCIILIVVIYFIGMTAYLIISLRNCSKAIDNAMKLRDGGDFYYKKYAQSVELCDLTDIGQTKEIIVIPSKIDGLPVKRFGKNGILSSYSESFHSDVLKRIYFPDMIIDMHTLSGCTKLEKVFFLKGIDENMANTHNNSSESIKIYINSRIYNPKTYNVNLYAEGDVNMFFANVSYMQNYEDLRSNGYYWIDDTTTGVK